MKLRVSGFSVQCADLEGGQKEYGDGDDGDRRRRPFAPSRSRPRERERESGKRRAEVERPFEIVLIQRCARAHRQPPAERRRRHRRQRRPVSARGRERERPDASDRRQAAQDDRRRRVEMRFGKGEQPEIPPPFGQRVWEKRAAETNERPSQNVVPCESVFINGDGRRAEVGSFQYGFDRSQLRKRLVAAMRGVFVGEVETQERPPERERDEAERDMAAAELRPRYDARDRPNARARRISSPSKQRAQSRRRRPDEPQRDERQDERVHVPSQQQRGASLDCELSEAPLLREHDHAVKRQRRAEHVHVRFVRNVVAEIERVVRRERRQGRRERRPSAADDARERNVRHYRRRAEESQRQRPRRENLGGQAALERHCGELD